MPKRQPSKDTQGPWQDGQGTKEEKSKKLIKEFISPWVKTSDQSEWRNCSCKKKKEIGLKIIQLAFI